jgi:hypothetical protein
MTDTSGKLWVAWYRVPIKREDLNRRSDLAQTLERPRGLYAAWKVIFEIQREQEIDPTYQYVPPMPPRRAREAVTTTAAAIPEPPAMTPLLV